MSTCIKKATPPHTQTKVADDVISIDCVLLPWQEIKHHCACCLRQRYRLDKCGEIIPEGKMSVNAGK
jgi:hypothetical protein